MVAWNTTTPRIAILSGARTPLARAGTALKALHADELAKVAMQETLWRAGFSASRLDEVILGNVVMPADAANLARVAALWAGVPRNVPALTVQRNCASGMEAINEAAMRIRGGMGRVMLAGGAESMSNVPLLFPQETLEPVGQLARAKTAWQKTKAAAAMRPRHFKPIAGLELGLTDPTVNMIMGKTAEVLVQEFGISRIEQDAFALKSHEKAVQATNAGFFDDEIVPVYAGDGYEPVTRDNGPRSNTTMEALGKLRPLFDRKDGSVTVGNSCQITDGAATVLVADADLAQSEGITPLGYVKAYAYAALDPARMGLGPVYAIDQILKQTGIALSDIPLFEINEAFAGQVLACLKALASDRFCRDNLGRESAIGEIDPAKLNVNGGAIALGHPVGATGARIVFTLLMEMRRRNVNLGLAALCVGGGQGAAILLSREA
jgi:acetyl-CoA C-acetyltransferase/acetyl-CoA acyltransferase